MSAAPLVVVAPHATRSGSTRVLLDLLTLAAEDLDLPLAVSLTASGTMADQLQALGPPPTPGEPIAALLANSCLAAGAVASLAGGVPAAVYVHETMEVLERLPALAVDGLRRADLVLCVSPQAHDDLVAFGVDPERIELLPPIISDRTRVDDAAVAAARAELGAGPADRIVLGCGEVSDRKGTDLFVQLGYHLRHDARLRLAWVGRRGRAMARMLDHDVEALGQVDRFTWVDEVPDVAPYLAAADVLVMPSRDDPQPLVPLEAAQQGTPTVGFAIGGFLDLADAGAAEVVPYPDLEAMAASVWGLLGSADARAALVARGVDRIAQRQSAATVVPRFVALVRELVDQPGRGTP